MFPAPPSFARAARQAVQQVLVSPRHIHRLTLRISTLDLPVPSPYLSLVTPVYRCAAFIEASVREMFRSLEQLERPCEVIVVDDGIHGSAERASAVSDPRLRVLRYEQHQGKGVAVTCGLAHARGRLVGWLDSDLDIHPDVIVEAARHFEKAPDIDAVIGSKRHSASEVLSADPTGVFVGISAARSRAVPHQRARHASRREAVSARDARHCCPAAPDQALRLRPRAAGRGSRVRLRPHRGDAVALIIASPAAGSRTRLSGACS